MTDSRPSVPGVSDAVAGRLHRAVGGIRLWLGLNGLLALVAGIVILLQPAGAAVTITMIIAGYAAVTGLLYIMTGATAKGLNGFARLLQIVLGVLFIATAVIAFLHPLSSTLVLAVTVAVFIAISWVIEGIAALTTLDRREHRGWTIFFAIVSILAGIALFTNALAGFVVLLTWLGISLIVLGVLALVRGLTFGRR